jgi:hypothetical protein
MGGYYPPPWWPRDKQCELDALLPIPVVSDKYLPDESFLAMYSATPLRCSTTLSTRQGYATGSKHSKISQSSTFVTITVVSLEIFHDIIGLTNTSNFELRTQHVSSTGWYYCENHTVFLAKGGSILLTGHPSWAFHTYRSVILSEFLSFRFSSSYSLLVQTLHYLVLDSCQSL